MLDRYNVIDEDETGQAFKRREEGQFGDIPGSAHLQDNNLMPEARVGIECTGPRNASRLGTPRY